MVRSFDCGVGADARRPKRAVWAAGFDEIAMALSFAEETQIRSRAHYVPAQCKHRRRRPAIGRAEQQSPRHVARGR